MRDAGTGVHGGDGGDDADRLSAALRVAKALGARGSTREISADAAKRLGPMADKHEIMIGFHNHTQLKPDTYDGDILSYGKYLGINLDTCNGCKKCAEECPCGFLDMV